MSITSDCTSDAFVQVAQWNTDKPIDIHMLGAMVRKKQFEATEKHLENNMDDTAEKADQMVVLEDVPREEFLKLLKTSGYSIKAEFIPKPDTNLTNGNIVCTGQPCSVIGALSEFLKEEMAKVYKLRCSSSCTLSVKVNISRMVHWTNGCVKLPDAILTANQPIQGSKIALNEFYSVSDQRFEEEVRGWVYLTKEFDTSIGVKIHAKNKNGYRKITLLCVDRRGTSQKIDLENYSPWLPLLMQIQGHRYGCVQHEESCPMININLKPLRKKFAACLQFVP